MESVFFGGSEQDRTFCIGSPLIHFLGFIIFLRVRVRAEKNSSTEVLEKVRQSSGRFT